MQKQPSSDSMMPECRPQQPVHSLLQSSLLVAEAVRMAEGLSLISSYQADSSKT